jgi:hypothetical protein
MLAPVLTQVVNHLIGSLRALPKTIRLVWKMLFIDKRSSLFVNVKRVFFLSSGMWDPEITLVSHFMGNLYALPENIRIVWKCFSLTNGLAYYFRRRNRFIRSSPARWLPSRWPSATRRSSSGWLSVFRTPLFPDTPAGTPESDSRNGGSEENPVIMNDFDRGLGPMSLEPWEWRLRPGN